MTGWSHRMRLLAACITLLGSASLLEAAPVPTLDDPCNEADMCGAGADLAEECSSMNDEYWIYCPTHVTSCMRDELGQIWYLGVCQPYEHWEGCPLLSPCA
jgi:hypothetical protein